MAGGQGLPLGYCESVTNVHGYFHREEMKIEQKNFLAVQFPIYTYCINPLSH